MSRSVRLASPVILDLAVGEMIVDFLRMHDAALAHAVNVGVIELHPPGTKPNPRTFSKEFRDNWASGALKLVTDSRTLKYVASVLGDRSAYKDALILKANQLASEGK